MNKKIFVFGDIHFGRSQWNWIVEQENRLYDWVINTVEKYNCEQVIFLGDRFKERDPEGEVRDRCDELFYEICKEIPVIALVGNHDMYGKVGDNSYGLLKKIKGMTVIEEPTIIDDMEFIPWGYKPTGKGSILFGHLEVKDMFWWSTQGITYDEHLKSYKKVITGHIHDKLQYKNVIYSGVPFQRSFGDGISVGGLLLNGNKVETIEGYGVRFLVVQTEEDIYKIQQYKQFGVVVRVLGDKELYKKIQDTEGVIDIEFMPLGYKAKLENSNQMEIINDGKDKEKKYEEWVQEYVKICGKGQEYIEFGKEAIKRAMEVK